MFIHSYTYDVLIYFLNYNKNSSIIKLHVNILYINEWLCMMIFFVHINITIEFENIINEILKHKSN
jgi:hypothetical protein